MVNIRSSTRKESLKLRKYLPLTSLKCQAKLKNPAIAHSPSKLDAVLCRQEIDTILTGKTCYPKDLFPPGKENAAILCLQANCACLASKTCLCATLQIWQPQKHSLAEGFVLNPLFLWGYPGFYLSLQSSWKPPQGPPLGLPGSEVSRGELLLENAALTLPTLPEPGVSDSLCHFSVSKDLLSSVPRSTGCAITRPELTKSRSHSQGLGLLFSRCLQGAGAQSTVLSSLFLRRRLLGNKGKSPLSLQWVHWTCTTGKSLLCCQ